MALSACRFWTRVVNECESQLRSFAWRDIDEKVLRSLTFGWWLQIWAQLDICLRSMSFFVRRNIWEIENTSYHCCLWISGCIKLLYCKIRIVIFSVKSPFLWAPISKYPKPLLVHSWVMLCVRNGLIFKMYLSENRFIS